MGGIIEKNGQNRTSVFGTTQTQKNAASYYRTLAREADKQARAAAEQGLEEEKNLLRAAAQARRSAYETYRAQQAQQKTKFAAAGLDASSATVGQLLQSDAQQLWLEEEKLARGLSQSLTQTRQQTAEKIRGLQADAAAARSTARTRSNGWKFGSRLFSFFTQG